MTKEISILGCGWLGLPLAKSLVKDSWIVNGSTTSKEKKALLLNAGINPFVIDLKNDDTLLNTDFFRSNYLIINIPPSKSFRQAESYTPLIKQIEKSEINKVIFVSSTSVYPSENQNASENSTDKIEQGTNALLDVERQFQKATFSTTVVRFGGLVGGERYPGRFFKADSVIKGTNSPVNLIHLDDCLQIIKAILTQEKWGETYNGVADTHPTKKDFYTIAAQNINKKTPQFTDDTLPYKIIANSKTKHQLKIELKHPDLIKMLHHPSIW